MIARMPQQPASENGLPTPPAMLPAPAETPRQHVVSGLQTGLEYFVAGTLDDVEQAWHLVYHSYTRIGLIERNPVELHTVPEAVGSHAMVVLGRIGPVVTSTISAYMDNEARLPLDKVYPAELAQLRAQGRGLCEVGLFADRRAHISRTLSSLFELMRYAFFYAKHQGADDIIIGVHPKHAAFYTRLIAFEPIGQVTTHPDVRDHPVTLLRLDLEACSDAKRPAKGIRYFYENPLGPEAFAHRYKFAPAQVYHSCLGRFVADEPPAAENDAA